MTTTRILLIISSALLLVPSNVLADSNGVFGSTTIVNSETVVLGGPFDHGDAIGSPDNSTTTATFVGGFTANQVQFTGTYTETPASATVVGEADIVITDPAMTGSYTWQNSGFGNPFDYDETQDFTASIAALDPAGAWGLEFIDTFDDGPGADAQSTNVEMTFLEVVTVPDMDSTGNFSLGTIADGGTLSSVGEFITTGIYDAYSITLPTAGMLTFGTMEDPGGISMGDLVDTEIAIYDALGNFLVTDDDGGPGTYSLVTDESLAAGDYTIVVSPFSTTHGATLSDISVSNFSSTGDYALDVEFTAVPEPSSFALAALSLVGILAIRRRNQ